MSGPGERTERCRGDSMRRCGCGGLCDAGEPCPMSYNHRCPDCQPCGVCGGARTSYYDDRPSEQQWVNGPCPACTGKREETDDAD